MASDSQGLIFHSSRHSVAGTSAIHCAYTPPPPQTVLNCEVAHSDSYLDDSLQLFLREFGYSYSYGYGYDESAAQSDQLWYQGADWNPPFLFGQDQAHLNPLISAASSGYGVANSPTISSVSQFEGDSTFDSTISSIGSTNARIGLQEPVLELEKDALKTPLLERAALPCDYLALGPPITANFGNMHFSWVGSNEVSTVWNGDEEEEEEGGQTDTQAIMFIVKSNEEMLYDGFSWRKYGEKTIKKRTFRRSYFKCGHGTCVVKKHVERSSENPADVLISYFGCHNHHAVSDF